MRENGVATLDSKCTLSLDGPLIIYPYWTQFTLKLTGSRLVSLAKLTSKLTIYDRSFAREFARSFVYFPVSFYSFGSLYSGTTSRWIYQNIVAFAIKDQGSLLDIKLHLSRLDLCVTVNFSIVEKYMYWNKTIFFCLWIRQHLVNTLTESNINISLSQEGTKF